MSTPHHRRFRRRHYHRLSQLWGDLRRLRALRGRGTISPAWRERLMLVVTAVNRCRYCATFHTHVARLSGLAPEEVTLLMGGSLRTAPEAEIPSLLYARQWAESAGQIAPALQAQLATVYGPAQAAAIERVLLTIWVGNLLGNSWDALLFRLSGGRLGNESPSDAPTDH